VTVTRQSNRTSALALLCCTILLAACQLRARLSVAPNSTASDLTFVLSAWDDASPGTLAEFQVSRCIERGGRFPEAGETMWRASARSETGGPIVGRLRYGSDLDALNTVEGPIPLTAGCYIVRAYAAFPDPRAAVALIRVELDNTVSIDDDA
jgi:hypothetical protein